MTNVGPTGFRFTPDILPLIHAYVGMRRSDREIGQLLGCDHSTVQKIRRKHGIQRDVSGFADLTVKLSPYGKNQIEQEADRRDCTIEELVGRLLDMVALGNLFQAVLDE